MGVVVVAAGSGSRLGAGVPKAFVALDGVTLLEHAVRRALGCPQLRQVTVVAPSSHLEVAWAALDAAVAASSAPVGVAYAVVPGGDDRRDSVCAGLATLVPEVDVVLVHDAARCLAPSALFASVAGSVAAGHPAVVPGLPVVDTVKEVDDDGRVVSTPDRARLRAIQTPQGFARAVLEQAHALTGSAVTDDAALVERLGLPVLVVPGDPLAEKVTTPRDLALAQTMLSGAGAGDGGAG
ncbi:MAG: 2-C-methyl-D-erythritol 4-phosphate cytidylyltransferase [Actinomycetota bacterium]|nr:2-C-methyl-D-erythritol 4-phosphate cytidylyltransferase [Actinomycetota bacterium]